MAILLLYCEGHWQSGTYDSMQSHESRRFNCMSLLTVGAGSAMKSWEKLLIDEAHGSNLSGGIENCHSYRSGPVLDCASAVFVHCQRIALWLKLYICTATSIRTYTVDASGCHRLVRGMQCMTTFEVPLVMCPLSCCDLLQQQVVVNGMRPQCWHMGGAIHNIASIWGLV